MAKCVGLIFALAGVTIFIIQFLPTYIGKHALFWIFIVGGFIWGLDTLWSALKDAGEIREEIKKNCKH